MKLRVRQLANGKWMLEAKRWHDFGWKGVRIDRSTTTRGAAQLGVFNLPMLSFEDAGSVHYTLTWHSSQQSAINAMNEARSLLGVSDVFSEADC